MKSRTFEDVDLWRKAHAWVLAIYNFTSKFPNHELFGLTSQLRRAAVSVPGNFAEGFKKLGLADKVRFYNIAQGSLEECRYYLILSNDLKYGENLHLLELITEVSKILDAYITAIDNNSNALILTTES